MKIKSSLYKWHRTLGMLVLVPTVFWVLSGVLHPMMSHWFASKIEKRFLVPKSIDTEKIQVSLKTILENEEIDSIKSANFVEINSNLFHQIEMEKNRFVYFSTQSGDELIHGDSLYSIELAHAYSECPKEDIQSVKLITEYTTEYRSINRLLPVWKIRFQKNNFDVYVETSSGKLATFADTKRRVFIKAFQYLHNWGFIPGNDRIRVLLIGFVSSFILLVSLLGLVIYAFAWKKFRKIKASTQALKNRKSHRIWGVSFSIITLMFAFSGSYHVWQKWKPDLRHEKFDSERINSSNVKINFVENLSANQKNRFLSYSVKIVDDESYFRVELSNKKEREIIYINTLNGSIYKNGEKEYARKLVKQFSGRVINDFSMKNITKFKGEYGFVNKRLPVYKIDLSTEHNDSYYVDVSSGQLALHVTNSDRLEGFSFAFLHKFHFLDSLGKGIRDLIAVLAALTLLIIALKGWKVKRDKTKKAQDSID